MSKSSKCKSFNKLTFTQINEDQFLIECSGDKLRVGGENEFVISYIDFNGGPLVHIGRDFLGRGIVSRIDIIDTENQDYLMVKITIKTA